jgi:hypothetical protein
MTSTSRPAALGRAAARGAAAGTIGVLAMTLAEKAEQAITRRPDSYVPARALRTIVRGGASDAAQPPAWNHTMHWMTGMLLGSLRGVWSATGIRGVEASATHTVVRLAFDQTVENATGVGAPPGTWPRSERVVDYVHKSLYSLVTGAVADRWIPAELESSRGATSH